MADSVSMLTPDVRTDLLTCVQWLYLLFVAISFVLVSFYTARQIRLGRLLVLERSPMPFMMRPPLIGWIFVLSVLALIYLQSPLYVVVVLTGVASLLVENRTTVSEQFGLNRMLLVRAIVCGLLVFGAVTLIETPLTQFSIWTLEKLQMPHPEQQAVETFRQSSDLSTTIKQLIGAVLIFPVVEELFFRGILLTFFKNYVSAPVAVVVSAAVFAVAHQNLAVALPLWFLGIVLGVAYEHTGSILVPMTIHSCFNLATGLSLLIEKGNPS